MPIEHVWRETTPEGEKREVKAVKFGGKWRLQAKLKGEAAWTYYDQPSLTDLETLHDLISRKYQRRRATYEDVQAIEAMIGKMTKDEGKMTNDE